MQRSNTLLRAVFWIFLAAILAYFGFFFYRSYIHPLETVQVVSATVSESGEADGYVVRDEEVMTAGGVVSPVADGKKIAAGGMIAACYTSETALERADTILSLQEQIESLQTVLGETESESAEDMIRSLSAAVVSRNLDSLDALVSKTSYVLFGSNDSVEQAQEELEAAQAELQDLEAAQSGYSVILAEKPGLFTSATDGYETVGPDDLDELTPGKLILLFQGDSSRTGFGKMIYGVKWYYACILNQADAPENEEDILTVGQTKTLDFTSGYTGSFDMTVESIGTADSDGNQVVVFSCDTGLADVSAVREAEAEVVYSRQTGLLVPGEAITEEDGLQYVYVLTGLQARRQQVEILAESRNDYVLVQPTEESTLNAGDSVIVTVDGLYDGKVVK